jgi:hypothetical protein
MEFLPLNLNKDTREIADGEEALLTPTTSNSAQRTASKVPTTSSAYKSASGAETQEAIGCDFCDEDKATRSDAEIAQQDVESGYTDEERDALLLEAFKHEALRRREPVLWIPRDALGVGEVQVQGMPEGVQATMIGATLDENGKVRYEEGVFPPDYVRSDEILL